MSPVVNNPGGGGGGSGTPGPAGKSAYEIAKENGFSGTEAEWLESLQGDPGADSTVPGPDGPPGDDGKSAYDIAKDNGFAGSEAEWLESLQGAPGAPGDDGADGGFEPVWQMGDLEYDIYTPGVDDPDTLYLRDESNNYPDGMYDTASNLYLRIHKVDGEVHPLVAWLDANKSNAVGWPVIIKDSVGRTSRYTIRTVPSLVTSGIADIRIGVTHDGEDDAGKDQSLTWDDYDSPYSVRIITPEDLVTRGELEKVPDLAADYAWTGKNSWARVENHADDWIIHGPSKAEPSNTDAKLLYVHRNSLGGGGDAVNYTGKTDGGNNVINRTALDEALADLDLGGGGVPPRFISEFPYKDNAIEYPKSFDARGSGSAANGPHATVDEFNLRITRDDPFWEVCDALYSKSANCSFRWRDGVGRTTNYLVRSVRKTPYEGGTPYDKYNFTVVYDPPPEGDWGTTTSWTWDSFDTPFSIEIEFPDDVITRELLAADHDWFAKHGFEFTDRNAKITFGGTHYKGDDFLKMRETWNSASYVYLRNHPTTNGCLSFDFAGSGSSTFAFHWDQTGDVVKIDRYGLKVNNSSVSRNVDILDSVRGARSFDDFKEALIAKLEAREEEGNSASSDE